MEPVNQSLPVPDRVNESKPAISWRQSAGRRAATSSLPTAEASESGRRWNLRPYTSGQLAQSDVFILEPRPDYEPARSFSTEWPDKPRTARQLHQQSGVSCQFASTALRGSCLQQRYEHLSFAWAYQLEQCSSLRKSDFGLWRPGQLDHCVQSLAVCQFNHQCRCGVRSELVESSGSATKQHHYRIAGAGTFESYGPEFEWEPDQRFYQPGVTLRVKGPAIGWHDQQRESWQ